MTRTTVLFVILAIPILCNAQTGRNDLIPVPPAAKAVGYTDLTFSTTSFSRADVDLGLSYASGFQWYPANFFGDQTSATETSFNADGSVSQLGPHLGLSSVGKISRPPYFVGKAFGCGAYFTAEMRFDPAKVNMKVGWPSWWSMSAEHLVGTAGEHWDGQAPGYNHVLEVDFFEYDRNQMFHPHSYASAVHEFFGIYNKTCAKAFCEISSSWDRGIITVPSRTDWNTYHRVAALWVPATASRAGYVNFYFDDVLAKEATVTWSKYTGQAPPPTESSPWRFGIIDRQHLALMINSYSGAITVRSVQVWQNQATACNMTN